MSLLLAIALMQAAAPAPVPVPLATPPVIAVDDARLPVSLWVGSGDRLSFAFGRALGTALTASPTVRQAMPIGTARYRMVLRRLPVPRRVDERFAYTVDLIEPREGRREHVVRTVSGRCTAGTLETCAADATARITNRLGG
ncbi:MAG: hypothetical protein ABW173_08790 [Sphingomonas sp.]